MSQTGSLKQQKFPSSPFWSSGSKAKVPAAPGLSQVSLPNGVCSRAGLCMHTLGVSLQIHRLVSACTPSVSPCRFMGWSLHAHPWCLPVDSRAGLCMHTFSVSLQIHRLVSACTPLVSPCRFKGWSLHAHPQCLPVDSQAGLCMHTLGVSLWVLIRSSFKDTNQIELGPTLVV